MANGLYELDGAYYFARYDGTLVTNGSAYVETTAAGAATAGTALARTASSS
ncbi:MAG: hypothetical protein ACLUNO_03120 [Oscillospiraceae bacterium]